MRILNKPNYKVEDIYHLCISKVRRKDLKTRLASCTSFVTLAAQEYEKKIVGNKLHTITPEISFDNIISSKEMNDVYTLRMVPKKAPGRLLYDKLLNAPPHGICPLCGQRIATTLDHHLPKAEYPALSVVPINLVPACKDCNTIKLNDIPSSSIEETLHPYFDNVEEDKWLFASIIRDSFDIIFEVNPPEKWSPLLSKRVKNHFEVFELGVLYSKHAAVELINIRYLLHNTFKVAGSEQVKLLLESFALSRENAHKNSWQSAFYRALAEDKWFQTEGVLFI